MLSLAELSTTFQVCACLPEISAKTVERAIEDLWFNVAGPPDALKIDGDGAFKEASLEAI